MSLQPSNLAPIDRSTHSPFLLRLYWRPSRPLEAWEFSLAPPSDTSTIADYSSLLPAQIRQQSVQIYTWPTCTLGELTGLLGSVLPESFKVGGAGLEVGTRLVYKLIFPDTRGAVSEGGRGKWVDKPLGSVVVGGRQAILHKEDAAAAAAANGDVAVEGKENLEGDAERTLADARFVIGDYVACTIYPPTRDGRVAAIPAGRGLRDAYPPPRAPPPRENGFGGGGGYGGGRGGYRGGGGGYGGRGGGFGSAPPAGDWRRGDAVPGGGGYRGRGGRPY